MGITMLIATAHREGIKIILDSVHHMHYKAPEYIRHPERFSGDVGFPHLRKRNLRNIQAVDATWKGFESWLNAESDEVKPDGLRTDSQHELILQNSGDELRYLKRLHSAGPSLPALNSHSSGYVTFWQSNDNPEQIWSYGRIPVEGACIATVVNNCEHSVALEDLVGGGIPTQGYLHSGTLVNVLDSAANLEVTDDGLIVGTVPAMSTLIVRNA